MPITNAADDIFLIFFHRFFFFFFFLFQKKKLRLDISCESSARQRVHMKQQVLFSVKEKSKNIKVSSAAIFLGCLRVKVN